MFTIDELLKASRGKVIRRGASVTVKGVSIDSRSVKRTDVFVAIKGERFDGHTFVADVVRAGARVVIGEEAGLIPALKGLSEDLLKKITVIAVKNGVQALGDLAHYRRCLLDIPVIAVTGSNGKTTTKEMVSWVLAKRFKVLKNEWTQNNHIGVPMALLKSGAAYDCVVLELGTNHPGEIANLARIVEPTIGVITNIGPAHLEFLKDLAGVMKEKWSLSRYVRHPKIMLLNGDDIALSRRLRREDKNCFTVGFGITGTSDFHASQIAESEGKYTFTVNDTASITLQAWGCNNIYNALAAVSIGRILGMEYRDIASRFAFFSGLPNRLNVVKVNDVRFINDTYNSNPASLKQALDVLASFRAKGRKIFVMGDMRELGDSKEFFHREAGETITRCCNCLITVGELSKGAAEAARLFGFDPGNIFTCESALQARDILAKTVTAGKEDVVLVKGSRSMKMEQVFECKT